MRKLLATTIAAVMISSAAYAEEFSLGFTIPSGSVISSSGEVMPADQTETGRRSLEQDGYLVAAGNVYISVNGQTATIPVHDLQGKSKNQISDHIKSEVINQLSTSPEGQAAITAATEKSVENGNILDGLSGEARDAAIDQAINDVANGVTNMVSEDVLNEIGQEAFEAAVEAVESSNVFNQLQADLESGYIDSYIDANGNTVTK